MNNDDERDSAEEYANARIAADEQLEPWDDATQLARFTTVQLQAEVERRTRSKTYFVESPLGDDFMGRQW